MQVIIKHLLIFNLFILGSCALFIEGYGEHKLAKGFYEKQNYDQAALYASKSLKLNPNNIDVLNLFKSSYELALDEHESNIINLEKIKDGSKWPKIFIEYNKLKLLNDHLSSLKMRNDGLLYNLDLVPKNYDQDIQRVRILSAEYYYLTGLEYIDIKSSLNNPFPPEAKTIKENQRKAAKLFKLVQEYVPNYKDSKYLYSKSRAEALLRLSIKTFSGNENLVDYIRDRMIEYQTEKSKEFLELSIQNQDIRVDHLLNASLTTRYYPSEVTSTIDINQEKTVVVRHEKVVDDEGKESTKAIKEKVNAKVTHYKKSSESKLEISYQIIDYNSKSSMFTGSVKSDTKFFHEWATYTGDKRALSSKYNNLIRKKDIFAPIRSELEKKSADKISLKLMNKISAHYFD